MNCVDRRLSNLRVALCHRERGLTYITRSPSPQGHGPRPHLIACPACGHRSGLCMGVSVAKWGPIRDRCNPSYSASLSIRTARPAFEQTTDRGPHARTKADVALDFPPHPQSLVVAVSGLKFSKNLRDHRIDSPFNRFGRPLVGHPKVKTILYNRTHITAALLTWDTYVIANIGRISASTRRHGFDGVQARGQNT